MLPKLSSDVFGACFLELYSPVSKFHALFRHNFDAGEIIAPENKSRSVKDPKILKTFRTYFFTALLHDIIIWMSWDSKMIRVNGILFHPSIQK